MKKENYSDGLSEDKRYMLRTINRLDIGSIILLWGSLLTLKEFGIIGKDVDTLPFVLVAFGILLVFGGIYRLMARERTATK